MRLISFFALILLSSCASIIGLTKIKELKTEEMASFLKGQQINNPVIYFIDTDYQKQLHKLSNDTALLNHHLQPLQASYYNKEGRLISFHINCNAPGFANLNWNYKKVMEVFPPKPNAELDTLLNLQRHLEYLKSSNNKQIETEKDFDYFIIVNWAGFLKRQSIGLINAVNENIKLNLENKKIKIIYVCSDNVYIE